MKVPRFPDKKELLRSPRFWGTAAFLAAYLIFMVIALNVVPDISAAGRIAAGDTDVPICNLTGREIFVYHSPQYGEKIQVPLSEIADELIALTITTEDSRFFTNPGFSPAAIFRAFLQNLWLRETYSGASTITQQVVRNIFFPEEVRFQRSVSRKLMEIFLSVLITVRYDKQTILGLYLNEIYYGRNATGAEMAAQVYFGKHASDLDLNEAAFIAGLPQAPNYYGNNPSAGKRRALEVLRMLDRAVSEDRCIPLEEGSAPRSYCPR